MDVKTLLRLADREGEEVLKVEHNFLSHTDAEVLDVTLKDVVLNAYRRGNHWTIFQWPNRD